MFRALHAVAAIAASAHAAGPSRFFIVSESFSDNGALFYYRIVDVQPDGPGSLVRYIRVAPSSVACPGMIIQAAESRVLDKSPAQLTGATNPSAVKPTRLDAGIRKYRRRAGTFETISFGLVASCDGTPVRLALAIADTLKFLELKSTEPAMSRLWNLASDRDLRLRPEGSLPRPHRARRKPTPGIPSCWISPNIVSPDSSKPSIRR